MMQPTGNVEPPAAAHRTPAEERGAPPSMLQRVLPIYYALALAILTVAGIFLLLQLRHVLVLLFISLLFAATVASPAARLERFGIPRGIAAVLVYAAAVAIVVGIGWLVLPTLANQFGRLGQQLPGYVERYNEVRDQYDRLREEYPALPSFDEQAGELGAAVTRSVTNWLRQLPTNLFGILLDVLSVFAISLMLITGRTRLLAFTLSMVHPRHRAETQRVLELMWQRLGHYLRAKLIVMAIVGALMYVALLVIGVPFPLLLAIVVAFGELIPRAGPWLARIPLLGIAALEGLVPLGLTFAASVVIENAKGYVISPFVEGSTLDIPPLMVFIAVLVGASLLGPAGAFIAVPAAAMLQVVLEEVVIPWRKRQLGEPAPSGVTQQ
jgi:predicted PurR-regulated permease PerM